MKTKNGTCHRINLTRKCICIVGIKTDTSAILTFTELFSSGV